MRPNNFGITFLLVILVLFATLGHSSGASLTAKLGKPKYFGRQKRHLQQKMDLDDPRNLRTLTSDKELVTSLTLPHAREVSSAKDVTISVREPKSMPGRDVASRVRNIIAEQLDVDIGQIDDNASLIEDLGADSLGLVELILAIEEEFECDIPDEDAEQIKTVIDLINYVKRGCLGG
ncbi:acyl carrier protein 2, chloroplastic [Folsomia candida]|uniref:Acyl carrier protein n=1 Tax=Folsomia candida TaxID=158441 RepID=A0A226DHW3_FOLCA|nr:acyl carrier protein 2, chloroplastic [Folsomia candida]OXA44833.1 Acyl carrier protein [Folsomia candida]